MHRADGDAGLILTVCPHDVARLKAIAQGIHGLVVVPDVVAVVVESAAMDKATIETLESANREKRPIALASSGIHAHL